MVRAQARVRLVRRQLRYRLTTVEMRWMQRVPQIKPILQAHHTRSGSQRGHLVTIWHIGRSQVACG